MPVSGWCDNKKLGFDQLSLCPENMFYTAEQKWPKLIICVTGLIFDQGKVLEIPCFEMYWLSH